MLQEMMPFLTEEVGNSFSPHSWGSRASMAVEKARLRVAKALGAEDPYQIVFTGGASEGNSAVLNMFAGRYLASPYEHNSIHGRAIADGRIWNEGATSPELLAWMVMNNETGTVFQESDIPCSAPYLLRDATQAVGKLRDLKLPQSGFLTFSGHKLGGPKGVGALYTSSGDLPPLVYGEQEEGRRGGTVNVAGVVGLGLATELARARVDANIQLWAELRSILLEELSVLSDWQVNGVSTSPAIVNIGVLGLTAETLLIELDAKGFAVSSGAACSSRSTEPSHVLVQMEVDPVFIKGAIRISFGTGNSKESTRDLGRTIVKSVEYLRANDDFSPTNT